MSDEIITFGKHKGKPVFALAEDKSYTEWLLAQPWFKEKYINVYNVVINNFRQHDDTPEHNGMQIKFLDKNHALKLAYLLEPKLFELTSKDINSAIPHELKRVRYYLEIVKEKLPAYDKAKLLSISEPKFEQGYDVSYAVKYGLELYVSHSMTNGMYSELFKLRKYNYVHVLIEIKPTIGDDYPSILRQLKASMPVDPHSGHSYTKRCLLVGSYTGIGASKEQFIQFFNSQGYIVVFESQLNNVCLPHYEEEFQFDSSVIA